MEAVLRAATEHKKLLELNAHPSRLDLDDIGCASARSHGAQVVIATDAHTIVGLDVMRYGVMQARRGGLTKKDVANSRSWDDLKKWLGGRTR